MSQVRSSTKQIPIAEPPVSQALGWSLVYYASELERCAGIYSSDIADLLGGGSHPYRLETNDPLGFIQRCSDEYSQSFAELFEALSQATSTDEQPEVLAARARKVGQQYGHLIQLSLYLNGVTSPSEDLADACHSLSAWRLPTFMDIKQTVLQTASEYPAFVDQLRAGANPPTPRIRIGVGTDDSAFEKAMSAIEKLKSET